MLFIAAGSSPKVNNLTWNFGKSILQPAKHWKPNTSDTNMRKLHDDFGRLYDKFGRLPQDLRKSSRNVLSFVSLHEVFMESSKVVTIPWSQIWRETMIHRSYGWTYRWKAEKSRSKTEKLQICQNSRTTKKSRQRKFFVVAEEMEKGNLKFQKEKISASRVWQLQN